MKIQIKKATNYQCEYTVIRDHKPVEVISLEIKTYFLHDICHYVVEKNLKYPNGFWGLLSKGYAFNELFGKHNLITRELRFIEQVVGPVQSTFLRYIPRQDFQSLVKHINFPLTETALDTCLTEIESILKSWRQLSVGEQLVLHWEL